jgi:gliding motility-associated-like protein
VVAKKVGFCDASDSVMVSVDTGGGANINPPILFTPNGDTFNDVWKIPDTDSYPDCTMTVYDGHGSQMYQQKPYNSSNYWDGTYNGKLVPEGTYFYVFSCPTLKPATGTVLVVR